MTSKIDEILAREMTRKQFLITLGKGIICIFGFSAVMGIINENAPTSGKELVGYGMQDYGP